MREILYRGQTRRKGEKVRMDGSPVESNWVYGGIFQGPNQSVIYGYDPIEKYCVYSDTVGQFTGLTANGKKIFEGDIVRVERDLYSGENKKERETFNGVVWYDEKHTCFGLKSKKYRCLPIHRFKGDYSTVIGNIHDNPELLEVENA